MSPRWVSNLIHWIDERDFPRARHCRCERRNRADASMSMVRCWNWLFSFHSRSSGCHQSGLVARNIRSADETRLDSAWSDRCAYLPRSSSDRKTNYFARRHACTNCNAWHRMALVSVWRHASCGREPVAVDVEVHWPTTNRYNEWEAELEWNWCCSIPRQLYASHREQGRDSIDHDDELRHRVAQVIDRDRDESCDWNEAPD